MTTKTLQTKATNGKGRQLNDVHSTDASQSLALPPEARHGLAGEILDAFSGKVELDPAARHLISMVTISNFLGNGSWVQVHNDIHPPRLNLIMCDLAPKARGGMFLRALINLLGTADSPWAATCVRMSLPEPEEDEDEQEGEEEKQPDPRCLVIQNNVGSLLGISPRIAWLWPGQYASGHQQTKHVALVANIGRLNRIKPDDLTKLARTLGKQSLFCAAFSSKDVPLPTLPAGDTIAHFAKRLSDARAHCQKTGQVELDHEARLHWTNIYPTLRRPRPGLLGLVLYSAEALVLRTALVYALLDSEIVIQPAHLRAALALWQYNQAAAAIIVGDRLEDSVQDKIYQELKQVPKLSTTQVHLLFSKHQDRDTIHRALVAMQSDGLIVGEMGPPTGGRRAVDWRLSPMKERALAQAASL